MPHNIQSYTAEHLTKKCIRKDRRNRREPVTLHNDHFLFPASHPYQCSPRNVEGSDSKNEQTSRSRFTEDFRCTGGYFLHYTLQSARQVVPNHTDTTMVHSATPNRSRSTGGTQTRKVSFAISRSSGLTSSSNCRTPG